MTLFRAATRGETEKADALYRWFLPLLRMDVLPKFVQYIKLAQQEVGKGNERVRGPRLVLAGTEREEALKTIRAALASRPT
jgi:4-hydroxy-tetrahydrodipicolinate synthase